MTKLHELLAAEQTSKSAWNVLQDDTMKKFKAPDNYFRGHSKSLKMLNEGPENRAIEDAAREEKEVPTNVYDTFDYALDVWGRAEDLQFRKNKTNQQAVGTVMWRGAVLLADMPVDELLGLESRIGKMRDLFAAMPTLDASKAWGHTEADGPLVWVIKFPEETTKTEKVMTPVEMSPATDKHPAQVMGATKDITVGKFTTVHRSGAVTALQKAECIKRIDELLTEIKQARMRANETEAPKVSVAAPLIALLLEPLKAR